MTKKIDELKEKHPDIEALKSLPDDFNYETANIAYTKILKSLDRIEALLKDGLQRKKDENSGNL